LSNLDPAWYVPGTYPVAPGVHRIPLPLPGEGLRAVNIYVVEDAEGPILIDAGWSVPEALDALRDGLSAVGINLKDVRRTLITHMHFDHYTLAITLRRLFGTSVEVGLGERRSIELAIGRTPTLAQWLVPWGVTDLSAADLVPYEANDRHEYGRPDRWIEQSEAVRLSGRALDPIPTPGHTQGHLVFADFAAGILFTGDHILPTITPSIGLEPVRHDLCLMDYLNSLDVIARLPDLAVLPAHGLPGGSSQQRVAELKEHHARRLRDTLQCVKPDGSSAFEIAQQLPWTSRQRSFNELDTFNRYLAIGETAAHLNVLELRGELAFTQVDGTRVYERTHMDGKEGPSGAG
jgi:glyoxylase-like metal-dependent hydrolase (beta-lactamase superfamily II)